MAKRNCKLVVSASLILFFLISVKGIAQVSKSESRSLMLATTTSVDTTGLLDVIADEFKKDTGITLKWIAVGTGQALKQAQDGNADVVIVHAKKLEDKFMEDGYGLDRRVIARNYFMLVGPENDPAGVAQAKDVKTAMQSIKNSGATFVSRADKSGTHTRELELWSLVGGVPEKNYMETGQGMAQCLRIAAEKQGYTLTDSATFYGVEGISGLKVLFENSPELENIYAVIVVNPGKIPSAKYYEAEKFDFWLVSKRGQKVIGDFQKNGRQLFEPYANKKAADTRK